VNEQKKSGAAGQAASNEFVRGVLTELRRVTWPTRDEWVTATVLTIALVVGIGLFTWLLDNGVAGAIDLIHKYLFPVNI
jgi:preprotein translocase subunit SecE